MKMSLGFRWSCVLLLLLVLPLIVGCNDDDDGPLGEGHDFGENDPNKMSAIGDSITSGGWPGILGGMMGRSVVNRGSGGSTSSSAPGAANRALSSDKPGYLLIQYGANDAIHNQSAAGAAENLRAAVQAAKANMTIPVVATVTPMYGNHLIFNGRGTEISEAIRNMADLEGVAVADTADSFDGHPELIKADGLHPTPEGQQEIAAVFFDVLN